MPQMFFLGSGVKCLSHLTALLGWCCVRYLTGWLAYLYIFLVLTAFGAHNGCLAACLSALPSFTHSCVQRACVSATLVELRGPVFEFSVFVLPVCWVHCEDVWPISALLFCLDPGLRKQAQHTIVANI